MAKPVALDVDTGSDASSIKTESSPPSEKKLRFPEMAPQSHDSGHCSEKENMAHVHNIPGAGRGERPSMSRTGSMQGKELKRQFSMTDALERGLGKHTPQDERGVARVNQSATDDDIPSRFYDNRGHPSEGREPFSPENRRTDRDGWSADRHGRPPAAETQSEQFKDQKDHFRDDRRVGDRRHPDNRRPDVTGALPHEPRLRGDLASPEGRHPSRESSPHPADERTRERPSSRERYAPNRDDKRRRDESRHRSVQIIFFFLATFSACFL